MRISIIFLISLLMMGCSYQTIAECQLSDEYLKLRTEVTKQKKQPYNDCLGSVRSYIYWKEYALCTQDNKGKDLVGGCSHLVGRKIDGMTKEDSSHCNVLKVTTDEIRLHFEEMIASTGIKKCK